MAEELEVVLARIEERVKNNNEIGSELLRIVKGDNGSGLVTRVAILEQHPGNCPHKSSISWLKWGLRAFYGSALLGVVVYIVRSIF